MDLQHLKGHIRTLITLKETGDPLVSCYLNLESGRATYRDELDLRVRVLRQALLVQARRGFEEALGRIEAFLASGVLPEANAVALFARAGVEPFFLALQFKVPLPNHLGVDTVPVGELPPACPCCGERKMRETNLKEQLVRLAEMLGVKIEIVRESDVLFDIGGVGCLLRYRTTEQRDSEPAKQGR